MIRVCSWCQKVDDGQSNWKEMGESEMILNLPHHERLDRVTHGMCPDCYTATSEQLAKRKVKKNSASG